MIGVSVAYGGFGHKCRYLSLVSQQSAGQNWSPGLDQCFKSIRHLLVWFIIDSDKKLDGDFIVGTPRFSRKASQITMKCHLSAAALNSMTIVEEKQFIVMTLHHCFRALVKNAKRNGELLDGDQAVEEFFAYLKNLP